MEIFLYNINERNKNELKLTANEVQSEYQVTVIQTEDKSRPLNNYNDIIEEMLWQNTVKELSSILRSYNISIPKGSRKADLINMILVRGLLLTM